MLGSTRRCIGIALLGTLVVAGPAAAVTITYVNPGPADSLLHGGNSNDSSGNTSAHTLSHPMAISRNDTLFGPLPPPGMLPNFDATTYAGFELATDLYAFPGASSRDIGTPFAPSAFRASGSTLQPTGSYAANAYVFSGDTTSTSPTPWTINVDPSGAEVPGTPTDVTVSGVIDGSVSVAGVATADATWTVATVSHGTVMSGSISQTVPGSTAFNDSGVLNFTIPLGTDFQLLLDYDLSATGSGAGASSTSEITLVPGTGPFGAYVFIDAVVPPPPVFAPVTGAKLLMIDKYDAAGKAKVVLVIKDKTVGSISKGPAVSPADLSGYVVLMQESNPLNRAVFDLDAGGWTKNTAAVAKYKNAAAGTGADGARAAIIKPDKIIKLVARNLGDGDAATGDQDDNDMDLSALTTSDAIIAVVHIENADDSSTHRMCARFLAPKIKAIAGGTGLKYLSKTSMLPATCPW